MASVSVDLPSLRPDAGPNPSASLYERLGGHTGIAQITRSIIRNHLANPQVSARYEAVVDMPRVERHVVEFFCAGAGGPESYTGKEMIDAHRGMNVSEQEFAAVVDDALAALDEHRIDAGTRNEVLGIMWSLKGEIVRR